MKAETVWKCLFVTTITLARVGQGMYLSIAGPTLLFLADHFGVEVSEISIMFTLRSLGMVIGALGYSLLMYKTKFNPLLAFGPGTFVLGLMVVVIPWLNTMAGLLVTGFISGFMFSFVDGAMQTVYLRIWGEERSRPFIQSFHFGISVGGLIAPIIASPFLQMATEDGAADPGCPGSSQNSPMAEVTTVGFLTNSTSTEAFTGELNPVAWSYVIVGGFSILISIPLFAFCACGLEGRIIMIGEGIEEGRNEEPVRDVWQILLLVFFFYFFNDMLEATYTNYIYSIALCSGAGFTVSGAASLNSLFWIGYLISRLVAILYSRYFKPRVIIIYGIALIITAMAFMCAFGESIQLVMTLVTLCFGISVAPFYPTGVTWTSEVTDISGKYMFVFMFGAGLDSMIMLPVAGVLFDMSPFNVMYLVLAAAISIALVFIGMEIVAAQHRKRKESYKAMGENVWKTETEKAHPLPNGTSYSTKL